MNFRPITFGKNIFPIRFIFFINNIFFPTQSYNNLRRHNWTNCIRRWRFWFVSFRKRWLPSWRCATSWSTRRNWRTRSFRCCWACRINDDNSMCKRNVARRPEQNRQVSGIYLFLQLCRLFNFRYYSAGIDPKYLTTVIPYHMDNGPPENQALQVLIKSKLFNITFLYIVNWNEQTFNVIINFTVLKAINEDSPTVPTLLTDYILKVLCPT